MSTSRSADQSTSRSMRARFIAGALAVAAIGVLIWAFLRRDDSDQILAQAKETAAEAARQAAAAAEAAAVKAADVATEVAAEITAEAAKVKEEILG